MEATASVRRATAQREAAAARGRSAAALGFRAAEEVQRLGVARLRLGHLLGRPLLPFYRWQGPLGRPKTWPQFWTSSGWFRSPVNCLIF